MTKHRFPELDIWRGLAVLGMIVFHVFFFLRWYVSLDWDLFQGWWLLFARIIQWSFLLLVGFGIFLKSQTVEKFSHFYRMQVKRAATIMLFGLLITLVTWIVIPEWYIGFGILHLIAVSILFLSPLARVPVLSFFLVVALWLFSFFIREFSTSSSLLFLLGIPNPAISTLDYFPVIPWMGIPAFGIFLASLYVPVRSRYAIFFESKRLPFVLLQWLGRHALSVYLLHVPIIIGLLRLFSFI